MIRILILGALLVTGALALAPEAAAACEPGTDPDFCPGNLARGLLEKTEGARDDVTCVVRGC